MKKKKSQGICEECVYFEYDEEYECYVCTQELDSDEMERFITNSVSGCPYYKFGDEYTIVRKQN